MQIAAELQNNRTKQAWYSAQLLAREYGTHIITSVDAGATLVQETHIKARGGTLGISGWGCAAGTLEPLAYTRASSAEFCHPILE